MQLTTGLLHSSPVSSQLRGLLGVHEAGFDALNEASRPSTMTPSGGTMGPTNTSTSAGTGAAGAGSAAGGTTGAGGTAAGTASGSGVVTAGSGGAGGGAAAAGATSGAAGTAGSAEATAGTDGTVTAADAGVGADAGGGLADGVQDLNDGQLLFIADTLNAGEADQARAALPRLDDEAARAFAQDMIEEHEPARDPLLQLAEAEEVTPELSPVATDLREESEQVIAQLLSTPGANVDARYIASQVRAHSQAFQLLEGMIAAADSEAVAALLTELRASVGGHLDPARELQDTVSA